MVAFIVSLEYGNGGEEELGQRLTTYMLSLPSNVIFLHIDHLNIVP